MVTSTAVKRRSVRRLAGHKRPSYYESDSDNDSHGRDEEEFVATEEPANTRRSARQVAVRERAEYAELSSEDDVLLESADEGVEFFELPPPKRRRRQGTTTKPATRSATSSRQAPNRSRRAGRRTQKEQKFEFRSVLGAPLKKRAAIESVAYEFCGPSDGKIPPWTTLPFEILRDIFYYASQPLLERTVTAQANVKWLLRAATTCRAFAVPALETFYYAPALLNHHHPLLLRERIDPTFEWSYIKKPYINYATKIRRLEADVNCLAYSVAGKKMHLSDLVKLLPSLQHFHILHPMDEPPYRTFHRTRWQVLPNLFDAINDAGTQLKSWRWNRLLLPTFMLDHGLETIGRTHATNSFKNLQSLVVTNFDPGSSRPVPAAPELDQGEPPHLAAAISVLPNLRDLTFVSCDVIMDKFLLHIPTNLERLELSNCLEITSDMLLAYLASGGSNLRELELHHNAALNLSFLTGLRAFCPRLEVLKMNLTYYSERENFNDAWIMYDNLLTPAERPTWPSTLRRLELVRLQKVSPDTAVTLYSSLIDSAEELPDLRHLTIQAQIDIPWRDRASFRDRWIDQFERAFLRSAKPPNLNYGSFKQIRLWKESKGAHTRGGTDVPGRYKLSHIAVTPHKKLPGEVIGTAAIQLRRSARVIETQSSAEEAAAAASATHSEDEDEDEATAPTEPEGFRQGLCNVVDIRIDNQRPRERQWTEKEFLDSEASGDEDWHEGGDV